MPDITNPLVINFSNQYLRPIMEDVRDLQLRLTDASVEYTANIANSLSGFVGSDPLIDGRLSQGVTQITKQDIVDTLVHLSNILAVINTAGTDILRAKLTVRPPKL